MRYLLLVIGLWALGSAAAQETADEAERLRQIEEQRAENARRAAEIRERAEAAAAALEALRRRLVETADGLREAEVRLTQVEDSLERLNEEEAAAQASLTRRQEALSEVLAALISLERSRPPALAVSPDDATQAAVAAITLSAVTPELEGEADRLREDIARIDRLRTRRAAEREELEEAETALAERRRLLEDLLAEREEAQEQDTAQLRALEEEDARLAREATNLRELIAGIAARERPEVPELPAVLPGGPEVYASLPSQFSAARALLTLPAAGRIVSVFGQRTGDGAREDGIAIATRAGAVVTAPFDGIIDWAENFGRLGNVIIIDVGEDYRLVLIGVGQLAVRRGQQVRAGEPLGAMGGGEAGILKFQVRRRDLPVNPVPWLRPALVATQAE
ncbi:MAG: peptidoglycan DD-metalloendopeptidase family protein [Pseudomonadota bacterium]